MHEIAYREVGLGRSLYAPQFMMAEFSPDLLREYVNQNFSPDRVSLSAVGMDLEELKSAATSFSISSSVQKDSGSPAKYFGGEARENSEDLYAYTLLVGEGAR